MRLGTIHSFEDVPGQEIGHEILYSSGIEQIVRSEEVGYDWVNLTEHHVTDDGYCPALMPVLGALATATETIGLSTGMVILTLHHPIRIAEEAAVVDLISGGRLTLGIAAGYRELEFEAFGIPYERRGKRFEESIEILQRSWTGEAFSFDGEIFQIPEVTVRPRPAQRPGPKLWLGGLSNPALRRAALHDSPSFPGSTHDIDECAESLARLIGFREAIGKEGDPGIVLPRLAYIADTTDEARRVALPAITAMFERYVEYGVPPEAKEALSSWDSLDRFVIVGDEEHCAEQVQRYEAIGVTDLLLQFAMPTMDPARAMDATERFPTVLTQT